MKLNKRIFTLIELLVVVAVFAMLIGMLTPAFGRARSASAAARCLDNQRRIGTLMTQYSADFSGWYPRAEERPRWEVDGLAGWTNQLRVFGGAPKTLFHCDRDPLREFSYALNCSEIALRNRGRFGAWRQPQLDRAKVGPARLVLLEESAPDSFAGDDADQDNYFQNARATDYERHDGFATFFADGHIEKLTAFDESRVTYYTGKISDWQPPGTAVTW